MASTRGRRWTSDEDGSAIHLLRSDSYLGLELSKVERRLLTHRRNAARRRDHRYRRRHLAKVRERDRLAKRKRRGSGRDLIAAQLQIVPLRPTVVYKTLPFVDSSRYGWATRRFGFYRRANDNQPRVHLYGQAADCIPDRALAQMPVVV